MSILTVEGVDGSGKTTLLRNLREQSKTYFWVASSSGRPKTVNEIHEAVHLIGQATYLKMPVICDRFPLISEAVYGPVLRGRCLLDEVSELKLVALTAFLTEVDRIIYCRPPIEVIRKNITTSALPQLAGVAEHLDELVKRYDTLMDSFQDQVRVFPYNYVTDSMRVPKFSPVSLEELFFGGKNG